MVTIAQLFEQEKEGFARQLQARPEVAEAAAAARDCLARMQQAFAADQEDAALRREAARLFAVAQEAAGLLAAAGDVRVSLRLPGQSPASARPAARGWRDWLPAALCAVVTAMLAMGDSLLPLLLSLAATLACVWQAISRARQGRAAPAPLPEAHGEALADIPALLSRMEGLCMAMDRILAELYARQADAATQAQWTREQYAAVQMLWEAIQAQDGVFAMKAAPSLLAALEQQGVELVTCGPDTRQYFDTIPAVSGGRTIRPALLAGNRVLARGQVTVPMG